MPFHKKKFKINLKIIVKFTYKKAHVKQNTPESTFG